MVLIELAIGAAIGVYANKRHEKRKAAKRATATGAAGMYNDRAMTQNDIQYHDNAPYQQYNSTNEKPRFGESTREISPAYSYPQEQYTGDHKA